MASQEPLLSINHFSQASASPPRLRKGNGGWGDDKDTFLLSVARARNTTVESLSYRPIDSAVQDASLADETECSGRCKTAARWTFIFVIAVFIGLLAVAVRFCTNNLLGLRFKVLNMLISLENLGDTGFGTALAGYVALSLGFALVAAIPTALLEPAAAGSGISEVKCVLNGIALPRVLRIKTLLVKMWGLVFAVAAGLPVGKEGPMIHAGAIAACGLTQGKSTSLRWDTRWGVWAAFRNDAEKRDFAACGAAAGVAAAFGAPIGGVLFTIEEGASHWRRELVWRTFLCAIVTAWTLQLFLSGVNGSWGTMGIGGLFSFGIFSVTDASRLSWSLWELPLFVSLGAAGGIAGALMIGVQKRIARWRQAVIPVTRPLRRVLEVCALAVAFLAAQFLLSYYVAACNALPAPDADAAMQLPLQQFYCGAGEYNELASFFLLPPEDSIRNLFHFGGAYSVSSLATFTGAYYAFMVATYGVSVPSGLFIPAIVSGAGAGRLLGEALVLHFPALGASPGMYAFVGAAAMLGGVTRMTISLAVIMLEATGGATDYALPLVSTLMAARFVGNIFNESIYDVHIHLRGWPLLKDALPPALLHGLRTSDVMAKPPIVLREVESVGVVLDVLQGTRHHGFPVVFSEALMQAQPRIGSLAGLISRRELAVLLVHRAFHAELPAVPLAAVQPNPSAGVLSAYTITTAGMRVPPPPPQSPPPAVLLRAAGAAPAPFPVSARSPRPPHRYLAPAAAAASSRATSVGPEAGSVHLVSSPSDAAAATPHAAAAAGNSSDFDALRGSLANPRALAAAAGASAPPRASINSAGDGDGDSLLPQIGSRDESDMAAAAEWQPQPFEHSHARLVGSGSARWASRSVSAEGQVGPAGVAIPAPASRNIDGDFSFLRSESPTLPLSHPPPQLQRRAASAPRDASPSPLRVLHTRDDASPSAAAAAVQQPPHHQSLHMRILSVSNATFPDIRGVLSLPSSAARPRAGSGAAAAGMGSSLAGQTVLSAGIKRVPSAQGLASIAGSDGAATIRRASRAGSNSGIAPAVRGGSIDGCTDGGMEAALRATPPPLLRMSVTGRGLAAAAATVSGAVADDSSGVAGPFARMADAGVDTSEQEQGGGLQFVADDDIQELVYADEPLLREEDFRAFYPRLPETADMKLSEPVRSMYVDLRPYLNPCPFTVHVHAPAERALELFRALGLRHLPVTNDSFDVVGMLTRHEFQEAHLRACVQRKQATATAARVRAGGATASVAPALPRLPPRPYASSVSMFASAATMSSERAFASSLSQS